MVKMEMSTYRADWMGKWFLLFTYTHGGRVVSQPAVGLKILLSDWDLCQDLCQDRELKPCARLPQALTDSLSTLLEHDDTKS